MTEYKDYPFEVPDKSRRLSDVVQNEALKMYRDLKDNLLLKAKDKIGDKYMSWYADKLDQYGRELLNAGYTYSDTTHCLAYHPIYNSGPNADFIYTVDFDGQLSVKNFLAKLDTELDNI